MQQEQEENWDCLKGWRRRPINGRRRKWKGGRKFGTRRRKAAARVRTYERTNVWTYERMNVRTYMWRSCIHDGKLSTSSSQHTLGHVPHVCLRDVNGPSLRRPLNIGQATLERRWKKKQVSFWGRELVIKGTRAALLPSNCFKAGLESRRFQIASSPHIYLPTCKRHGTRVNNTWETLRRYRLKLY